jgi:chemosensory pili system protein ChpA (sensor histidine kinase/response regulator)
MANGNVDQELLDIFLEEATDLVAALSTTLREWQANLGDLSKISELKRDLHTLKGSARMVGQMAIGTLGHEIETVCEVLAKGQVQIDRKIFELICLGQDQIAEMVECLKKGEVPTSPEDLIRQFQYTVGGTKASKAPPIASLPETPPLKKKGGENAAMLNAENIRIRADLLEKLDNLSTENNRVRVALEQQVGINAVYIQEVKEGIRRLENELGALTSENDFVNVFKSLNETASNIETLLLHQARISTELQYRLSGTRLVPFQSILPRLSRIARQLSLELQKEIDFKVLKTEGEMDRTVLEHLIPSLEHILRNALDHGIETEAERIKKGKPAVGKITVDFERSGATVAIIIADDGAGIDTNRIREKAIKLGLLAPESPLHEHDAVRYILAPGFSTRETVSEISGRGVGMDVVNMAVKEMGGTLEIESTLGEGTKFTIRFPFTISLNRMMLFTVQEQLFSMLLANIGSVVSLPKEKLQDTTYQVGGANYHVHYLGSLLQGEAEELVIPRKESYPVILFSHANYPVAFIIDTVLYNKELVVQALGTQFKLSNLCSGATLLGDGTVVYVLDPYALCNKAKGLSERGSLITDPLLKQKPTGKALILVVDDSVSVRTVTKRFLEQHQFKVATARDGVEALQYLETHEPNMILLDIDMPRMDGFEFANIVLKDNRLNAIPIVVITSRAVEHKKRAVAMNLPHVLAKPFQEFELMELIQTLLGKKI